MTKQNKCPSLANRWIRRLAPLLCLLPMQLSYAESNKLNLTSLLTDETTTGQKTF